MRVGAPTLVALLLAATACPAARAASPPPPLLDAVVRLESVPETEDTDGGLVPPEAARLLRTEKRLLRGLIARVLASPKALDASSATLRDRVVAAIGREGVPVGETIGNRFGAIEAIELRRSEENRSWLVATTTLSIPCGQDTSVYLFEADGDHWRLVLVDEADGYASIDEAHGELTYEASPVAPGTKPFLVVADVNPWCSSNWQTMRYRVLRPGASPEKPVRLSSGSASVFDADCGVKRFLLRPDGFTFVYQDMTRGNTTHSAFFVDARVRGNTVLAKTRRELDPDAWFYGWESMDPTAAAASVDASIRKRAETWREKLAGARYDWDERSMDFSVGSGPEGRELRVAVLGGDLPSPLPKRLRLTFADRSTGFVLVGIEPGPDELCGGSSVYVPDGTTVTPPVPIRSSQAAPVPPASMRTQGIRRKVKVTLVVDADGTVRSVDVADPKDLEGGVGLAAIEAVRKWRFEPGRRDGRPVAVSMSLDVGVGP